MILLHVIICSMSKEQRELGSADRLGDWGNGILIRRLIVVSRTNKKAKTVATPHTADESLALSKA